MTFLLKLVTIVLLMTPFSFIYADHTHFSSQLDQVTEAIKLELWYNGVTDSNKDLAYADDNNQLLEFTK